MMRIFFDSSVLFSAAYSSTGHSRDLLLMAVRNEIIIVISNYVQEETRRNLAELAPEYIHYLDTIFETISFELIRVTEKEIHRAANLVVLKDAPILASAKKAKVACMVTLDRKHLLDKPPLADYIGAPIVTPKQAMALISSE